MEEGLGNVIGLVRPLDALITCFLFDSHLRLLFSLASSSGFNQVLVEGALRWLWLDGSVELVVDQSALGSFHFVRWVVGIAAIPETASARPADVGGVLRLWLVQ